MLPDSLLCTPSAEPSSGTGRGGPQEPLLRQKPPSWGLDSEPLPHFSGLVDVPQGADATNPQQLLKVLGSALSDPTSSSLSTPKSPCLPWHELALGGGGYRPSRASPPSPPPRGPGTRGTGSVGKAVQLHLRTRSRSSCPRAWDGLVTVGAAPRPHTEASRVRVHAGYTSACAQGRQAQGGLGGLLLENHPLL